MSILSSLESLITKWFRCFNRDFNKDFFVTWSPSHVNTSADGRTRSMKLDQESGAGFASNQMFLFGQIDMQIKLVPGDSAGTVVAYYLTSDQPNRDEVDFEFLGNVAGKPYILQTNILLMDRATVKRGLICGLIQQRTSIPIQYYGTFTKLCKPSFKLADQFMVDWVPIRVYRNHADKGVAFPRWQPMSIKTSLWNGDSWATRGGKDKTDWSKGPFIASFRNYKIDACVWKGNARFCRAESPTNWWNKNKFSTLTKTQRRLFKWVRKHHMIYDYCQDKQRFQGNLPKECSLPKY
ncbi:putative xyloglucan endotransglucosylase/hydrolase protein 10 [Prunus yedoensis var. nudiflora]|uniref:Xyloglucan endotransglucosylase/hydrolase n=1 Tax=Prunus yedoensis var. nudiflora TaxID=2094558 RepID=A0A314U8F3_PRUYE|nr:putative xyloglucan endotransglucosylase/hydrolase protein 10 [Prunus yedoensis var. nudiflora]